MEAKVPVSEKKAEAIKRMKYLGIFPETIKQFDDGYISMSEPPVGAYYWVEGEDLQRIREFEKSHNALVYSVIRSYTEYGIMDNYLYVSDYKEDWPFDYEDINDNRIIAYVYSHEAPEFSESGLIGFKRTPAAGLARTW